MVILGALVSVPIVFVNTLNDLAALVLVSDAEFLSAFASLALPAYGPLVAQVLSPLMFGELPIIFWLLIRGAKEPGTDALAAGPADLGRE
jgi:hypothetical protein